MMFDIDTEPSELCVDGTRADVYLNLNEENVSIMSREMESDDYGNVIGHADFVLVSDVEFIVQDAGQQRVRNSGTKGVHAFVRGTVEGVDADAEIEWNLLVRMFKNDLCNVRYDPFETDHFTIMEFVRQNAHTDRGVGDEIHSAAYASVTQNGVGVMLPAIGDGDTPAAESTNEALDVGIDVV